MQNVLGIDISTVSSACGKTEYVTDWNIGNISDGSSGSFTIITKIGTTFSSGDIITNSAFTLQDDENNLNNTSTVTTMVIAPSILFPSI
jgi:hypothetical protein